MVQGRNVNPIAGVLNTPMDCLLARIWHLALHLAPWALQTLHAAVRDTQEAAWTLQRLSGGDHGQPGRPKSS